MMIFYIGNSYGSLSDLIGLEALTGGVGSNKQDKNRIINLGKTTVSPVDTSKISNRCRSAACLEANINNLYYNNNEMIKLIKLRTDKLQSEIDHLKKIIKKEAKNGK